ncbi:hypothetical protein GCM10022284_00580 [Streptomyces hundungensis]
MRRDVREPDPTALAPGRLTLAPGRGPVRAVPRAPGSAFGRGCGGLVAQFPAPRPRFWLRALGWLVAQFPAPLKPDSTCGPCGAVRAVPRAPNLDVDCGPWPLLAPFLAPLRASVLARIGHFSPSGD